MTCVVEPEEEALGLMEPDEQGDAAARPEPGKASISRTDAIRVPVAEGMKVPEDGTRFDKSRFEFETSKQHFSATKSQIKKRDAAVAPKRK